MHLDLFKINGFILNKFKINGFILNFIVCSKYIFKKSIAILIQKE